MYTVLWELLYIIIINPACMRAEGYCSWSVCVCVCGGGGVSVCLSVCLSVCVQAYADFLRNCRSCALQSWRIGEAS